MSHVHEVWRAVLATVRWGMLRPWIAGRWAALVFQRWARARDERLQRAALRRKYIDFIRRMLQRHDDGLEQSGVLDRLKALEWEELQELYWDCERIADAQEISRSLVNRTAASPRDALWDLTPLLKQDRTDADQRAGAAGSTSHKAPSAALSLRRVSAKSAT